MGKYFTRTYLNLPFHTTIRYSFTFNLYGSWDLPPLGLEDYFELIFDSNEHLSVTPFTFGNQKISGFIAHSGQSLTIKLILMADQGSTDESLLLRAFFLIFTDENLGPNYVCSHHETPTETPPITKCDCPIAEFDFTRMECGSCHSDCTACFGFGSSKCYNCSQGYYLTQTTCNPCDPICPSCFGPAIAQCNSCITGYYLDQTTCIQCDPACPTCFGTGTNNCTSCISSYNLRGNSCCDQICPTCFASAITQCNSCVPGYYLAGNTCTQCDPICPTCFGAGTNDCTSCISSYNLVGNSCCDPICATCFGIGERNCTSCHQSYYLNGNSCEVCHATCLDCTGPDYNQCTACHPGFTLFRGVCVESSRCNFPFSLDVSNNLCNSHCPSLNFTSWNVSCFPPCLTSAIPDTDILCKSKNCFFI